MKANENILFDVGKMSITQNLILEVVNLNYTSRRYYHINTPNKYDSFLFN